MSSAETISTTALQQEISALQKELAQVVAESQGWEARAAQVEAALADSQKANLEASERLQELQHERDLQVQAQDQLAKSRDELVQRLKAAEVKYHQALQAAEARRSRLESDFGEAWARFQPQKRRGGLALLILIGLGAMGLGAVMSYYFQNERRLAAENLADSLAQQLERLLQELEQKRGANPP